MRKAIIAFLFHAPGVRLVYRERLGRQTARQNIIAIVLTLAAMAGTYAITNSLWWVLIAWFICHSIWGLWLAVRVMKGSE